MARQKLLLIGATGYVGGELLQQLLELDAFDITALVRTQEQADQLSSITMVIGTLDSHNLLVEESSKADIIVQAASADHAGIFSILEGASKEILVVHISGSGNLIDPERPGLNNNEVVSDVDDTIIRSLPLSRYHVDIERKLFESKHKNLIILSPGVILGSGRGTCRDSKFTSAVFDAFVKHGVFQIGEGENAWGWTSVGDVARAVIFVIENRDRIPRHSVPYCWVGTGEVAFHQRASHALERLKGEGTLKGNDQVKQLTIDEFKALGASPIAYAVVATSSRYTADKLKQWGFEPKDQDWRILVSQGKSI